jgi:hypothetical protein
MRMIEENAFLIACILIIKCVGIKALQEFYLFAHFFTVMDINGSSKRKHAEKNEEMKSSKKRRYKIDMDRLERGISHPLFLMEERIEEDSLHYKIKGTQGNVYDIEFMIEWTCSCPDFTKRGYLCKHIFFVLKKVLHYETSQLQDGINDELVLEHAAIRATEHEELKSKCGEQVGQVEMKPTSEYECAICCESFEDECKKVYCRSTCGKALHEMCYEMWAECSETCPSCRAPMNIFDKDESLNKFL